ncbi:toxin-antitoxin system YwqK family antitoxin [Carboxylicivirga marina]|uniref:Toxin-antitoxin system YwqK family antitoxin n=1 Tax=Carboxylicivirga marina TaxID=2800988 RepID=A0ABS1HKR3_9BACT|nr:hypothetical protein [Carboxylicivirga marina]MBK3518055.1 hypothetical protein [Carboxylicivirga marina]
MKYILFILFTFILKSLIAQHSDTLYYDKKNRLTDKAHCEFYRKIERNGEHVSLMEYRKDGTLSMTGNLVASNNEVFNVLDYAEIEGKEVGLFTDWDKDGNIISYRLYNAYQYPELLKQICTDYQHFPDSISQQLTYHKYYRKNETVQSEGFLDGACNYYGLWKWYNRKGKIYTEAKYQSGVLHGKETYYWNDGDYIVSTNYYQGVKHGKKEELIEGKLLKSTMFKNGKKHGDEISYYYEQGDVRKFTQYYEGVRHGHEIYFKYTNEVIITIYQHGKIAEVKTYDDAEIVMAKYGIYNSI